MLVTVYPGRIKCMAKNKNGFLVKGSQGFIKDSNPVFYGCSCVAVHKCPASVKNQITHMGNIGMLKMDNAVAICMCGPEIVSPDLFFADFIIPGFVIGYV